MSRAGLFRQAMAFGLKHCRSSAAISMACSRGGSGACSITLRQALRTTGVLGIPSFTPVTPTQAPSFASAPCFSTASSTITAATDVCVQGTGGDAALLDGDSDGEAITGKLRKRRLRPCTRHHVGHSGLLNRRPTAHALIHAESLNASFAQAPLPPSAPHIPCSAWGSLLPSHAFLARRLKGHGGAACRAFSTLHGVHAAAVSRHASPACAGHALPGISRMLATTPAVSFAAGVPQAQLHEGPASQSSFLSSSSSSSDAYAGDVGFPQQHRQHPHPAANYAHGMPAGSAPGGLGAAPAPAAPVVLPSSEYLAQHGIRVLGPRMEAGSEAALTPCQAFEDSGFPEGLVRQLYGAGFGAPSPIQSCAWPLAMQGRDCVAIAPTGSGKTAGYLLPALLKAQQVSTSPSRVGPVALVLAPTRELAKQIEAEALRFIPSLSSEGRRHYARAHPSSGGHGIGVATLYGGAPRMAQLQALRRSPSIVVATPGRLLDFMEAREVDLSQTAYLVLDEADCMLDMGFKDDMRQVVDAMSSQRQTLFFSATWPKDVQAVARDFVQQPVHVFIGDVQANPVASKSITQHVSLVNHYQDKVRATAECLANLPRLAAEAGGGAPGGSAAPPPRAMVFTNTKATADALASQLNRQVPHMRAAAIHGDLMQRAREFTLNDFRNNRIQVLVATDVASRGLDIPSLTAVINFDFPQTIDQYVHRIGRTGRAGARGLSLSLMTQQDMQWAAKPLAKLMKEAGQALPMELEEAVQRYGQGSLSAPGKMRSGSKGRGGTQRQGGHRGGYGSNHRQGAPGHRAASYQDQGSGGRGGADGGYGYGSYGGGYDRYGDSNAGGGGGYGSGYGGSSSQGGSGGSGGYPGGYGY